ASWRTSPPCATARRWMCRTGAMRREVESVRVISHAKEGAAVNTVKEPARETPVLETVDVVVVGGGVAGCAAAHSAATAGATTILIERNGFLGGVATASAMANIGNLFLTGDERQVIRGFPGMLVD